MNFLVGDLISRDSVAQSRALQLTSPQWSLTSRGGPSPAHQSRSDVLYAVPCLARYVVCDSLCDSHSRPVRPSCGWIGRWESCVGNKRENHLTTGKLMSPQSVWEWLGVVGIAGRERLRVANAGAGGRAVGRSCR